MIVIGSYALAVLGVRPFEAVKDLDLIGTAEDVAAFRERYAALIEREREEHGHRHVFYLKNGEPWERVEIDHEQTTSDRLLPALCTTTHQVLETPVKVPSLQALYFIKRAHANVPVHYDKTIRDIIQLKPMLGTISEAEPQFYLERKKECQSRYALHRQRFSLAIRNEDFFDLSDHVRQYVHDDLHEAVAHEINQPLYKRCKRDLSLAKIDVDLFEAMTLEDRLRMVQEEFMVIGVERFYLQDKSLTALQVYRRGMHKTIRDLFVGYFQDFCIDHIDRLQTPPPYDFLARFQAALQAGHIREVDIAIPPTHAEHKRIWQLIQQGELNEARRLSEDLIRRAQAPGDTHAFFLLGATLLNARQLEPAEKCLRRCVARDRKNALAWFHLGWLCRLAARHEEAVEHLQQAQKLGFAQFGLFWNLGLALEAIGRSAEAIGAYTQAKRLKKEAPNLEKRLSALKAALAQEANAA
jgi:tetratricopeptide (TPR) repeat protein